MSALDNPMWHSLITRHSAVAIGSGGARRYPAEIAPFAAIENSSEDCTCQLTALVPPGDRVGILGVHPSHLEGWSVYKSIDLAQYVWDRDDAELPLKVEISPLGEEHIDRMIALTQLVYPSYFRRGTAELGQYFGILDQDRLCAMAGVRLSMDGYSEISAVCTHPDYRGRGYAGSLSMRVVQHIMEAGDAPFLHTEFDNHAAQSVYERLGFTLLRMIPFIVLDRSV